MLNKVYGGIDANCRSVSLVKMNSSGWSGSSRLNKALTMVLGAVLLATIGAIVYVVTAPHEGERFTEFYILGPGGKADNYPTNLVLGEDADVRLGIVNHEYEEVSYQVEIVIDGVRNKEIGPVVLANEEKWEQPFSFIPARAGENQKVEFVLYKRGQDKPYLTLSLRVNVGE
jgi:uncharacterized membrane protein